MSHLKSRKFSPQKITQYSLLITVYCLLITACTPPTPPPSPTPWLSTTPMPVEVSPTAPAQATPQAEATSQATSTPVPRTTPVPATLPAPTTITVWASLPEAQAQLLAQDIEVFQAEFPHYLVALKHYDSPDNFMTPLMAGQIDFDVVLAAPVLLSSLWATEQIAPMSDFFPSGFTGNFATTPLLGAGQEGDIWGLPDIAGFHLLLFYNRDLVDAPPSNTTELFEMAEDLSQGSQWGLGVNSYDPLWLVPWLAPYGGRLTDDAGNPTLNTLSMDAAITLYLSWQGRLAGIAPVETYDEVRTKFFNGNIAMMIDGEWAIGELAATGKINWGVAPLPGVGYAEESQPASPLVLARYWAISQTAADDRALASAAFLEFITRPERQLAWMSQFGLLPTRREALDDPAIVNDAFLRVSAAQMQAGRAVPLGVNANLLLDAMREPLEGVIDGELTPKEAAEMMQANAQK